VGREDETRREEALGLLGMHEMMDGWLYVRRT